MIYLAVAAVGLALVYLAVAEHCDRIKAQAREEGYLAGWNDYEWMTNFSNRDEVEYVRDSISDDELETFEWKEVE